MSTQPHYDIPFPIPSLFKTKDRVARFNIFVNGIFSLNPVSENFNILFLDTKESFQMYDLFFLSNDEPYADLHWRSLQKRFPHARHVHGVHGLLNAHRSCAYLSSTSHFFVVDADNEITDFRFDYRIPSYDRDYVHLWFAKNPLNGLEYGWGGIKLFPKKLLMTSEFIQLDMTTSYDLKIIPETKSITHFNTSPLITWRSAFREAVKLSQLSNEESKFRLDTWCNQAKGVYAEYCLDGANQGKIFGMENFGNKSVLSIINNWEFLKSEFENRYGQLAA